MSAIDTQRRHFSAGDGAGRLRRCAMPLVGHHFQTMFCVWRRFTTTNVSVSAVARRFSNGE